jgi:hypothetical protein
VDELATLRFENVFNPYRERCAQYDLTDAPNIRRRNLERVLAAAMSGGVDSIWIARDLGYRGGRRTGLALTDEHHLACYMAVLGTPPLTRATFGPAMSERTATVIWQALRLLSRRVFLWNVFPLHPYEPGAPMTNRCHTRSERLACRSLLVRLLGALKSQSVVAIGRDAHAALTESGIDAAIVRHPSHGGQTEFRIGLATHYGVSLDAELIQPNLI